MVGDSKDYFAEHLDNENIARVVGMYRRIVARYGQTNFIVDSQDQTVVNSAQIKTLSINNDSTGTIAIVIISVIGLTAVGGYFFLRRRKEA